MHKIISSIHMVQQLLHLISIVESLKGPKVVTASDGEFPYLASLQYHPSGQHFCTGSLITQNHVLTAAHCFERETPEEVRIVLGAVHLQGTSKNYTVASWLSYVDWAHRLGMQIELDSHDIAILTLNEIIDQSEIHPVRLSDLHKKQLQGKLVTITGWKDDDNNGEILQKAKIQMLSDRQCVKKIKLITDFLVEPRSRVLCTQATPHVLLECGDSGAPLVDIHRRELVGISSGDCPSLPHVWGNFSDELLQKYKVNIHFRADYYRYFIVNVTSYH